MDPVDDLMVEASRAVAAGWHDDDVVVTRTLLFVEAMDTTGERHLMWRASDNMETWDRLGMIEAARLMVTSEYVNHEDDDWEDDE